MLSVDFDRQGVVLCWSHLRCNEAFPHQRVELELFGRETRFDQLRRTGDGCGPDRFMSFLRAARASAVRWSLLRQKGLAKSLADQLSGLLLGQRRDLGRIRAHVGDQAHGLAFSKLHPLIELLRDGHRAASREAKAPRRVLLQRAGDEGRRWAPDTTPALDPRDCVDSVTQGRKDRAELGLCGGLRRPAVELYQPGAQRWRL